MTIGRGQTSLGQAFAATLGIPGRAPRQLAPFAKELKPRGGCPLPVYIKEGNRGGLNEVCYAPSEVSTQAGVECSLGRLLIHLVAPSVTRSVRLTLSDGTQVTSAVMSLPRRFGGPRTLYYQAVNGPSPIPVSATEIGTHGEVLGTVPAHRVLECTRELVRRLPGARLLATVRGPGGATFRISSERTRILGKTYFGLKVVFAAVRGAVTGTTALRLALPLEWEVSRICTARPYGIIYGVLNSPREEVFVRQGAELQRLVRVGIPSAVRAHSVLVYAILGRAPGSLIVREPGGRTVVEEDIHSIFAGTRCA